MTTRDLVEIGSNIATAAAAAFVAVQVLQARGQLRATFEQHYTERYVSIASRLPLSALLGESVEVDDPLLRTMHEYFTLCEEQIYYRTAGKVSAATWADWWKGMSAHLSRPAFSEAFQALRLRMQDARPSSATPGGLELLAAAMEFVRTSRSYDPKTHPR